MSMVTELKGEKISRDMEEYLREKGRELYAEKKEGWSDPYNELVRTHAEFKKYFKKLEEDFYC